MQRRNALKNIGLSLGGITMSGTVISMLQGCANGSPSWVPKFFSSEEVTIITKTLDIILPNSTDIPGASELNLAQFIDTYIYEISTSEEQEGIKEGVKQYLLSTLNIAQKEKASELTEADVEGRLAYYLKAQPQQQSTWNKEVNDALKDGGEVPSEDAVNFSVLKSLRQRGISAFKGSEIIGETVLAYASRPGKQEGCVDLQVATAGKAWSLK